jgi:hypothetical protein
MGTNEVDMEENGGLSAKRRLRPIVHACPFCVQELAWCVFLPKEEDASIFHGFWHNSGLAAAGLLRICFTLRV